MEWRKTAAPGVSAETLDELETHLREKVDQLVRSGTYLGRSYTSIVLVLLSERQGP